jgi:hypothetical protein
MPVFGAALGRNLSIILMNLRIESQQTPAFAGGMANDPLKRYRTEVENAERQLSRARDDLRAAAKRHDLPTGCLFSESAFVLRSTAEFWEDKARRKGLEEGQAESAAAVKFFASEIAALRNRGEPSKASIDARALEVLNAARKARGEPPLAELPTGRTSISVAANSSPTDRALAIVNAGRVSRGEPPLTELQNRGDY